MSQQFSNAARAELAATINDTDTTISIVDLGALFPVANTDTAAISDSLDWFKLTIQDKDNYEIVFVRTHASGSNEFSNVLRGQEGTVARSFLAGSIVGLRPTAGDAASVLATLATLAPLTGEGTTGTWPISVSGNAATASKVAASRSIAASGDASWSVSFDGSTNVSAALTLANSGVVAGTYNTTTQFHPFTVDSKGRITSVGAPISITPTWASISGKPTTLAGYGITDAASASHTHNYIPMTGATNPGQLAYDSSGFDAVNFLWKKNGVQRWGLGKNNADNMALWVYNSSGSYIGAYTFGNGTEATFPWGLRSYGNIVIDGGSPTIEFRDNDNAVRYVHCNSDYIGFLTSSYEWAARSQNDGSFVVMGNIAAFSDERLKTNIEIIPNALDKVMALRGVTYSRKDVGGRQTGLIAQDVRSVLPEAVIEDDDEMKTLSVVYGNLVGLLVEAIKELKAEVNALKGGK